MSKRFTLYGLQFSGPSYKVALMLSLCGQDYAYTHVNLREGEHKTPAFLAKNRYGQVPALEDHSDGRIFVQAPVILEVLSDRLGKLGGADRWERLKARESMFWCMDRLAPPIYRMRAMRMGLRSYAQATAEMYYADGLLVLDQLEALMPSSGFLIGAEPCFADVDLYGVLHYAPLAASKWLIFPRFRRGSSVSGPCRALRCQMP